MAKNIFSKGFLGLGGGGGLETPFEAAIQGSRGIQNIFARQMELDNARQEQQAMNALRGQMGGMDMQNPDYAKIFSLAPEFGLKFMNGMAQLNEQQRLSAVNHFQIGQDIIARTRPLYAMNPSPELRNQAISALTTAAKYDRQYAEALFPDPAQFSDPKAFQLGILAGENLNETMKGLNEQIRQGMVTSRTVAHDTATLNQIKERIQGEKDIEGLKGDIVKMQQYHPENIKTGENQWALRIINPSTRKPEIINYPPGAVPEKIALQEMKPGPGAGKGGEKPPPITKRTGVGGQAGFKPGTYRDQNGQLHYITTQEQYDALNQ